MIPGGAITMAEPQQHPHLYLTQADIARAKLNLERYPWARAYFDIVKDRADKWTTKPDDEIRATVPPPESLFAYGFSGCPICGVSWPLWGVGGICSFDQPGKVTCPGCKRVFPDAEHPDDGKGWHDPKSGRQYYFVGCYNSFVAQTMTLTTLDDLSTSYALTGDEKYARAAAIMFDALAKIYPTCTIGSIDYPNHPGGRFERTQYQVARVLVFFARYYDLLYDSHSMDAPSQAGEATIRRSIEERILKNAAAFCFEQGNSGHYGLTNGEADFVRGVMCVGLVLDIPSYTEWCLSGPYSIFNFLENNLHHDGQYYETSDMYSSHALGLYRDMAEMLINYRDEKYPNGINLYEHPKFSKALVQAGLDVLCAGHVPRYGDSGPDVSKLAATGADLSLARMNAEHMYARVTSPEEKAHWAETLNKMCNGNVETVRNTPSAYFKGWLLYHAEPLRANPQSAIRNPKWTVEPDESALLDGKGLAILRSGTGIEGRAAFVRYGPSVCHGHRDDLNLNFFALGRELTYDFGYSLGSAHVQTGWANQTGSHNLVVVNEKPQLEGGPTGGSAELFADGRQVRMAELSSDHAYQDQGVDSYRRTIVLVDTDPKNSYLVDIFRVRGGRTHDLLWHALGDQITVEGAKLGQVEQGSLASPDYEWGTKIGPDGDINGQADKGPYWTAPPANGYGFLYNVRRGPVSGSVSATWAVDSSAGENLRIDILPPQGCDLITARGPGILPKLPHADFAILRRKGTNLDSTFTSVLQPYAKTNPVAKVESLGSPDAVKIVLADGRTDYVFSSLDSHSERGFGSADGAARFQGRFAFCRFDAGGLSEALLAGAKHLSVNGATIECEKPSYWGEVESVDYAKCRIIVNRELPADGSLVGARVYIGRAAYGHTSCYRISDVRRERGRTVLDLDTKTLVLGSGLVGKQAAPGAREIDNLVPLEMGCSCRRKDTGYFNGKLLVADDGTRAEIENVQAAEKRIIMVPDASIFKSGAPLTIYDVQPGDRFEIPTEVSITRKDGGLAISSTVSGRLSVGDREIAFKPGKAQADTPCGSMSATVKDAIHQGM